MLSPAAQDTRFRLTAEQAEELVARFGTPLYVVDERHFRQTIRRYQEAFHNAYADSQIFFASKANSTLALLRIAYDEGCGIDVASEGELRAAMAAGVPARACHLHGNNKTREEIGFAVAAGIGQIVVDNFEEIETLKELSPANVAIVLRLAPGVDPVTHHKISTGQADTKFGFNIADGSAEKATRRCLEIGLPLIGFHCHVGSQLLDPEAQRAGGELIAKFATSIGEQTGFKASYLNVGGGLGVKYTDEDQPMDVEDYCRLVVEAVTGALKNTPLKPTLAQEPGRALVSESGVTLYRVGVIKSVPTKGTSTRTYVSVDGGLSDNPRPALYGAHYQVEAIHPTSQTRKVTVSGKHCESDKLFEDIELPENLQPGDLIQVLTTGAYNSSMASNYNRYQRPATALIRESGSYDLVQRRETFEEMFAREIVPEDLR